MAVTGPPIPGLLAAFDGDGRVLSVLGDGGLGVRPGLGIVEALGLEDADAAALARCLASGGRLGFDVRRRDEGGALRVWACVVSTGTEGGQAMGVEITAQRRAADALREQERRLLRAEGREALDRLVGGLTHDLNNVLSAVMGEAELLAEVAPDHHAVGQGARRIVAAAEGASALTRRVLAMSKPARVAATQVDLNALVAGATPLLRGLVGDDVHVAVDLCEAPLHVRIDPSGVERVLLNLAANARDAMPGGGRLRVTTHSDGAFAWLVVGDTGLGMAEDVLARAFEPFFTTKGEGRGTGLGLAMVRELLRDAGGRVDLQSRAGEGTTARIRLPLIGARPAPAETPARAAIRPGRGESVLLVEDQDSVRETLRSMLERLGYRVETCDAAPAAAFRLDGADVLITDVLMPGMSGVDLARAARIRRPELPLLLISGYTEQDPEAMPELAPHAFLHKPFGLGALSDALRALLDTR